MYLVCILYVLLLSPALQGFLGLQRDAGTPLHAGHGLFICLVKHIIYVVYIFHFNYTWHIYGICAGLASCGFGHVPVCICPAAERKMVPVEIRRNYKHTGSR